ncbi:MAG: tetratricopeptide repeat protein [Lysobacter sp.]
MNYDKLDNEELLRLSLDAINGGRDADAVVMLKTLLEREPGNVHGQYLLAAQHAQLGMYDRAEAGFRSVIASGSGLPVARFQFSQLLLMKGSAEEARQVLAPLVGQSDALGAYARALTAAAAEDVATALAELRAGLAMPQEIPALAADMQRLQGQFAQMSANDSTASITDAVAPASAAPMFLANYGREG